MIGFVVLGACSAWERVSAVRVEGPIEFGLARRCFAGDCGARITAGEVQFLVAGVDRRPYALIAVYDRANVVSLVMCDSYTSPYFVRYLIRERRFVGAGELTAATLGAAGHCESLRGD